MNTDCLDVTVADAAVTVAASGRVGYNNRFIHNSSLSGMGLESQPQSVFPEVSLLSTWLRISLLKNSSA